VLDENNVLETGTSGAAATSATVATASDVLAGQDYYRNLVEAKEKGPIYDQMRNQNIAQVIDAGKNIAKNEVSAIQQYESSKYQAAQTIDKSGWSGGYALDTNKQLSYMRESIQADILSQKDLQKLGYKSALGQAIAATELQADQLALDRYRQARQDAEYTSQLTGYYVEPHIADMATQVSALSTLIAGEQEGSPNKAKYEATLKTLHKNLNDIIRKKNEELKAQGADYSFGKVAEDGTFISVTGIKTLAQIQRESQLRKEELEQALLTEDIEIRKVEAAIKQADLYKKLDAKGNVMLDDKGNIIYGSHSADRQAKMDELGIKDAELGIEIKEDQLKTQTYDPTTGSVIPVFNEDGTIKRYTNIVPTDAEEFEKIKSHFAENPKEFKVFFNNTLSQLKSGMSEGADFGEYFASNFSDINLKEIIDKYESTGESFSMGGVTFKKVEQEDQTVSVGGTDQTLPKDSWVVIDEATGSGYCYNGTKGGRNFAFTKVSEPGGGGGGGDEIPGPSTSSQPKGVYSTGLVDKDSKDANFNIAATKDYYASPDGRTHYVTLRGSDNKAAVAITGQLTTLHLYATAQAAEGATPTGAMNAREVETTVAAPSSTIVIKDDANGAEIKVGRIAQVGEQFWIRQQNGWSQLGAINDQERVVLGQVAITGTKVTDAAAVKEARMKGAETRTAGGTTYSVVSKEKGYALSDSRFTSAGVNNATITLPDGKWVNVAIGDKENVTNNKQPGEIFYDEVNKYWYISQTANTAFPIKEDTGFGNGYTKEEYYAFLDKIKPEVTVKGLELKETKDTRTQAATTHDLGGTAYKVTSKASGYEVTNALFNDLTVNNVTITLDDGTAKPKWVNVAIGNAQNITNSKQPGELFYQNGTFYISKTASKAYPIKKHTDFGNDFTEEQYYAFLDKLK
jgi:hypothetical protein